MLALDLDGKVAVVTGGGRGLGQAAACALADAGADIALLARTAEELAATARTIEEMGRRVLTLPTDVTQESAVEEAAEAVVETFGRVDILVNNAGVAHVAPLLELTLADLTLLLAVDICAFAGCAIDGAKLPHLARWTAAMHARPGVNRGWIA